MNPIERFGQYAAAFEDVFKSDDWSLLEPYFTEDAVYETIADAPFAGIQAGRDTLFAQLKQTLEQHKGKRPLYLTVRGNDGHVRRIRAGGDLRVDINAELTEQVDRLLGRGRVKLARM